VAAHPVGGPRDIVTDGVTGALEEDLASAAIRARQLDPAACVRFAQQHTWDACANELRKQLAPIDRGIATLAQAS
jgi:glycosyltransferase involved in cell wall biosynthesis